MAIRKKKSWFFILWSAFRILLLLLILAIVGFAGFLNWKGLPDALKKKIEEQASVYGIHLEFKEVEFEWFKGVVLKQVNLKLENHPGEPRISMDQLDLDVRWKDWAKPRKLLEGVKIAGGRAEIPIRDEVEQLQYITISDFDAHVHFDDDGTMRVHEIDGLLQGIKVRLMGQILPPAKRAEKITGKKKSSEETGKTEEGGKFEASIARVIRRMHEIHLNQPPQINIWFDGRWGDWKNMAMKGNMKIPQVKYRGWSLRKVEANWSLLDQVVKVEKLLLAAYDGEIQAEGMYDLDMGVADAEVRANAHIGSYRYLLPPEWERFLTDIEFLHASHLQINVHHASYNPARNKAHIHFNLGKFEYRGHDFDNLRIGASYATNHLIIDEFQLNHKNEFLKISGKLNTNNLAFQIRAEGDVIPASYKNILPVETHKTIGYLESTQPIRLNLTLEGVGKDVNRLKGNLNLFTQKLKIRGAAFDAASISLEVLNGWIYGRELKLIRPEGMAEATAVWKIGDPQVQLEATSKLAANQTASFFGPKFERQMQKYLFNTPPKIKAKGYVGTHKTRKTEVTIHVDAENFVYHPSEKVYLHSKKITGDFIAGNRFLKIRNLDGEFYGGRIKSDMEFHYDQQSNDLVIDISNSRFGDIMQALFRYENIQGNMNGKARIYWVQENRKSYRGGGHIHVNHARLDKIPMMGDLMKELSNVPGLGKEESRVNTTFQIQDGIIHFPDLEIFGGLNLLRATGKYEIDEDLDIIVRVHLMSEANVLLKPLVWITEPFTKLMEYHLGGKINDWKWRPMYLPKEIMPGFGRTKPKEPAYTNGVTEFFPEAEKR